MKRSDHEHLSSRHTIFLLLLLHSTMQTQPQSIFLQMGNFTSCERTCFTLHLGSSSKTNTILSHVKLGVVWTNKDISKDPQWARWHIKTKEATDALGLAHSRHLQTRDMGKPAVSGGVTTPLLQLKKKCQNSSNCALTVKHYSPYNAIYGE